MNRRAFVTGLGAVLAAPLAAEAQPAGKFYRIGVISNIPPTTPEVSRNWEAFRQGLSDHGWIEGQNVAIEYRWAEGRVERFPSLAAELVSHKPDLIVALPNSGVVAAKQATSTIPIVMVYVFDPVRNGLVASLARPGGNVTGLTFNVGPEIVGKHLELLREVVPSISRVAVTGNPELWPGAVATAQLLRVKLYPWELRGADELDGTFAATIKERPDALLVLPYPQTYTHARRIVQLAAKHQLPAVYPFKEAVDAGGLMAYGANAPDMFRRAGVYIDKILRGAKPADLPVEQPIKYELVINMKTAKALGLTIPPSLLLRADQVIE